VPDAAIIACIACPDPPASSRLPMAVEITPGLIELTRAPRSPQLLAAAATRIRFARLANG
jgi:hypothetical protein